NTLGASAILTFPRERFPQLSSIDWRIARTALAIHSPEWRDVSCCNERLTHRHIVSTSLGEAGFNVYYAYQLFVIAFAHSKQDIHLVRFQPVPNVNLPKKSRLPLPICNYQVDPIVAK